MSLNKAQIRLLRQKAHALKPVILIGQHGLHTGVMQEIEIALDHHQLLKIKISLGDRQARDELIQDLLSHTQAELVQRIGNMATLYRRNPDKPSVF